MKHLAMTVAEIRDLHLSLNSLERLCREMPVDHPLLAHARQHVTESREHITKAKYALGEYLYRESEGKSK